MARQQPTVEDLLARFLNETNATFYAFIMITVIRRLGQPSISEIRREIEQLAEGRFIHSLASDKQLIGRMDKTFGLIDCVGGDVDDRRFRLNQKGEKLVQLSLAQVVQPLQSVLPDQK